jgi:cytochrome c
MVVASLVSACAFGQSSSAPTNASSAIQKVVLAENLDDPMELAVTPDGKVLFVERTGTLKIWRPDTKAVGTVVRFPVHYRYNGSKDGSWEDGLMGITLDPGFATNHWIYLYYSPTNSSENRLSRFVLHGEHIHSDSERIILRVPMQREICCHSGGSLAFDSRGNLYLSTGDSTNPFESDGYAPIDYRTGRYPWDAAKSAGNTADLRGKILRIHPEADGSYTIPPGNLFAAGATNTRPEIFVMGCRNPFRISLDRGTDTLYWGEIGPDARVIGEQRGPAGFDEINRTRMAGNFGWPFVIADNKPYRAWDFAAKTPAPLFNVGGPENLSPNNTGLKQLPPAQPAWIWYPYSASTRFPALGTGLRCAAAGPFYRYDEKLESPRKLPREFDRTLFIYDWSRNWIKAVKLGQDGNIESITPFAAHLNFKRPIEMELGPDGCLYVIEFGTNWERNKDTALACLEYTGTGQN